MARGWGLGGAIPTEFELHYLDACPQLLQGQGFAAAGGDMWMGQGRVFWGPIPPCPNVTEDRVQNKPNSTYPFQINSTDLSIRGSRL